MLKRVLVAAGVMLSWLPPASAQTVTLTLALERPTVVVGEPVVAHVLLVNSTNQPVDLPAALEPEYGALRFFVRRPAADGELSFQPWALIDNEQTQRLAPGADIVVSAKIFYGANGWTFPSPGDYMIRVAFGPVSSPAVKLTVQEPAADAERTLSRRLIESQEAGLFLLLDGGDHLEQGLSVLRAIASGPGVLSGYANLALGVSQSRRFANLRTGQVRPPNPSQAQQLLERSRTMLPPQSLYFRIQSEQRLAEMLRLQGNTPAADQLDQQFQRNLKNDILKQNLAVPVREFAERAVIR